MMNDLIFSIIDKFGPYGFTVITLALLFLHERGLLPKHMTIKNMNGEKLTIQTLANNHIAHLEQDTKEIKEKLTLLAIQQEKLATYDWCEEHFKDAHNEHREEIKELKEYIDDRIKSIHDRLGRNG